VVEAEVVAEIPRLLTVDRVVVALEVLLQHREPELPDPQPREVVGEGLGLVDRRLLTAAQAALALSLSNTQSLPQRL
jgi:hypothetical protein